MAPRRIAQRLFSDSLQTTMRAASDLAGGASGSTRLVQRNLPWPPRVGFYLFIARCRAAYLRNSARFTGLAQYSGGPRRRPGLSAPFPVH